jgi:hypothetical protein
MPARSPLWATSSLLLILALPVQLAAQEPRAPEPKQSATVQTLDGKLVDQLPVDRIREAIILLPGVVSGQNGGVSLRGGRVGDVATYLDGVPVSPGYRKTEFIFDQDRIPAPGQSFLAVGTNSLTALDVVTGPLSPSLGRGQAGVILLHTLIPNNRFDARGSIESDRPFGSLHGPGIDRLQGLAGGRILDRLRVTATATIEGHESVETGPGAPDEPIFVASGVDTTVAVPSAINDPLADTVFVDVSRFAIARGRCDEFSASTNSDIADNYGRECQGTRIPATGSSSYQLLGKIDYALGAQTSLWLTGLASRDQLRSLEFSVPPAGFKGTSRVVTLGARHGFSLSGRPLSLNLALSFQRDQTIGGPLSPAGERESRDGFLLSGLEFLYDMESFPVNDELINNIRDNIAGSRRSPLDLENTSQYSLINRYRNSAYGLDGGPEAGGPFGRLMFLKENRTVAAGSAAWQYHPAHRIRAGIEITRYSIAGYSHNLTSQAFSDAFIADPVQSALYLEDEIKVSNFAIIVGARYDRFRSDAERPFVLDTVSSSARFGTYSYFPVPNSYGSGGITFNGQPLVKFLPDEARSAISPRIQVAFAPARATTIRLGVARQNQMPDLSLILSGTNTDLRVTNTQHVYGGDLDLERTTIYEFGARHEVSSVFALDASVYSRELDDQVVARLQAFRDPSRLGSQVDIRQVTSLGLGRVRGMDARLDVRTGMLTGIVGYSYQKAGSGSAGDTPLENSRPHTFTSVWAVEVPQDWGRGIVGTILRNVSLYGAFRYTSGTAYTRCPAETGNESVLSGETCFRVFEGDFFGARLPSTKHLDLRASRTFEIAGRELVAYLDGRNILNFENVLQVYAVTGKTSNPTEAIEVFSADSAGFADVGVANGIYRSNGEIDLTYGGAVAAGCGNFVNPQSTPSAPDCVYLIRAEERYGDGDHVFTLAEQRRASDAAYRVARGRPTFLGAPRRLRLGLEVRF